MNKKVNVWIKEEDVFKNRERYKKLFPAITNNIKVGLIYLKNGEEVGLHSTGEGEEVIVILSGEGLLIVNGKKATIKTGDVLYIGPHTEHNVKAKKDGEIRYTYIHSKIDNFKF